MIETDVDKMKMDEPEYAFLFIKSEPTPENKHIYDTFRNFCKLETKNDYTLGLKRLLEHKQLDWKEAMMYDLIRNLEERLARLEAQPVKENKKEEEAF